MADIDAQGLAQYRRDGFILVEGLLDDLTRRRMKQVLAELIEGARAVSTHDDVYDLEPTHSAAQPRVRRIKKPHLRASGVCRVHALAAAAGRAERAARPQRRTAARLEAQPEGTRVSARRWSGTRTGPSTRTPTTTCWPWRAARRCHRTERPDDGAAGQPPRPTFDHHGSDGRFCGAMEPARDGLDFRRAKP